MDEDDQENADNEEQERDEEVDYNYLLSMPLWSLSQEKVDELLKNKEAKVIS